MGDIFSVEGIMKLVIAIVLDIALLGCSALYLLGTPGIFLGEMFALPFKILSIAFLGNWSFKNKKLKLANKKIWWRATPLPFVNTIYVLFNL